MKTPPEISDSGLEEQVAPRVFAVGDSLFRITLTTGYATGDVNVWLLDGDEPVLFDTGTGSDTGIRELETALGAVGRKFADIRHLLLTHAHIDHCGAAGVIARESGCRVYSHVSELDRVRDFKTVSKKEVAAMMPALASIGFEGPVGEKATKMLDSLSATATSCPDAEPLPDRLETSAGTLTWAHRPGHSRADVLYFLEGTQFVLTGDHLLPHVATSPSLDYRDGLDYHQALIRYRESLKESQGLGTKTGCPGHGPAFRDTGVRAAAVLKTQEIRLERVRKIIAKTGATTVFQVTCALFGRDYRWEILMLANETAGYLKVLADEGACRIERNPGGPDVIRPLPGNA